MIEEPEISPDTCRPRNPLYRQVLVRPYDPYPTHEAIARATSLAAAGHVVAKLRLALREAYRNPRPVSVPLPFRHADPEESRPRPGEGNDGRPRTIPGKATRANMLAATRTHRAEIGQVGQVMITNGNLLDVDTEYEGRTVRGHTHPMIIPVVSDDGTRIVWAAAAYAPSVSDLDTMRPHPDDPENEAAFYSDPTPAQADYVHTETPGGIPITFAFRPVGRDTCEVFYKLPGGEPFRLFVRDADLPVLSCEIRAFLLEQEM